MVNKSRKYTVAPKGNSRNRTGIFFLFLFCSLTAIILGFLNGLYFGKSNYQTFVSVKKSDSLRFDSQAQQIENLKKDSIQLTNDYNNLSGEIDSLSMSSKEIMNYESYEDLKAKANMLPLIEKDLTNVNIHSDSKLDTIQLVLLQFISLTKEMLDLENTKTTESSSEKSISSITSKTLQAQLDLQKSRYEDLNEKYKECKDDLQKQPQPVINNSDLIESNRELDAAIVELNKIRDLLKSKEQKKHGPYTRSSIKKLLN